MTKPSFEICFICRFPTTDWMPGYGEEPVCGMCWAEGYISTLPSEEEQEMVYYAMARHWKEDMEAMLADH